VPVSTLLARPSRIAVLTALVDCERSLRLTRLVDRLHEDGQLSRGHDLPARPKLRTRLYHVDLPKLAAAGLVRFDAADRTVARTALTRDLLDCRS